MSGRVRDESGWAVLTAVMVIMLMMMLGLATYSIVDTQTSQSKQERNRESAFNLAEGALQEQGYVLGQNWRGSEGTYPNCSFGSGTDVTPPGTCPQPANLANANGTGNFTHADFQAGVVWRTVVRDNRTGGATSPTDSDNYDSTVETTPCKVGGAVPCAWDANGDNKLWVRATATVRGRTRTLVALLKRERLTEGIQRATAIAGHFDIANSGNKTMLDSTGGEVVVRCGVSPYSSDFNKCANYNASKGQISPPGSVTQVTATPPAMTAEQMARFKTEAQTATPPTYFTSCPPSLAGAVVYIDLPSNSSGCSFTGNLAYNSEAAPGLVIMPKGTLSLDGGLEYYGVIYLANCSACSPAVTNSGTVLNVGGNAEIHGGVLIDGEGGMSIGNSGNSGSNDPNIIYSPNAFNELATFGTAGLVQNTWQELSPGD